MKLARTPTESKGLAVRPGKQEREKRKREALQELNDAMMNVAFFTRRMQAQHQPGYWRSSWHGMSKGNVVRSSKPQWAWKPSHMEKRK